MIPGIGFFKRLFSRPSGSQSSLKTLPAPSLPGGSAEQFRALMECAPDGVCVFDQEKVLYINPWGVKLFGAPNAELLCGRPTRELVHPDSLDENAVRMKGLFERREIQSPVVKKMWRVDGTPFEVEITTGPLVWDGKPAAVSFFRSLKERRALESQLRQTQKMEAVGRLAGGVAHDFNNILAVIMLYVEGMLGDKSLSDSQKGDLKEMEAAVIRASDLVRQLLLFGQRLPIRAQSCSLDAVVRGVADRLRTLFAGRIEIRYALEEGGAELPRLMADPGLVEWALTHLALNARDAMPQGGVLTLSLAHCRVTEAEVVERPEYRAGNFVRLRVADTGVGMSGSTLNLIFDPFYTTKEVGEGSGLGLSTVYGIVRQHRGWMQVESEVGRGTTFSIYFPV